MAVKKLLRPFRGLLLSLACDCWKLYDYSGPNADYVHHGHNCRAIRMARWLDMPVNEDTATGWVSFG